MEKHNELILEFKNFSIRKPSSGLNLSYTDKEIQLTESENGYLLKNLNLRIYRHEILGIVGESGSGKSLSALSMLQLLSNQLITQQTGDIVFKNQSILSMSSLELRKLRSEDIAMVFQEPMVALNPVHTIKKQLEEIFEAHKPLKHLKKRQRTDAMINILEKVGLKDPIKRVDNYPHQFSGGERQRIIIAMAILRKPKILIADEATTALDVTTQKQIIDLLLDLKREFGMTLIFISHNLELIKRIADKVAVMLKGECIEYQPTTNLFSRPLHSYTQALIESNAPFLQFIEAQNDQNLSNLMQIKDLQVSVKIAQHWLKKNSKNILSNFNLSLQKGINVGIVGESGSGKSTMALAICKLIKSRGQVIYDNKNILQLSDKQFRSLRREFQIVFQDPYSSLNPQMTIFEIIAEGLKVHEPSLSEKMLREKIEYILKDVGLDSEALNKYPHQFSGGQRQRIAIARVMVLNPSIVILDEPTSALDKTTESQVISLLQTLQIKHNLTYIIISHDLNLIRQLCPYVVVLQGGNIIEASNTRNIFENPQKKYTKVLIDAVI